MAYVLEVIARMGKSNTSIPQKQPYIVRNMPHGMTTRKLL